MKYQFPIEVAERIIRSVNEDIVFRASDSLVSRQSKKMATSFSEEDVTIQMLLIDRLWSTQLYRDEGATEAIIASLNSSIHRIRLAICELNENDLKEDPGKVYNTAKTLFPIILDCGGKRHFSFTTKFFHWCTRQHFPISDSRARKSSNCFQRKHGLRNSLVRKSKAEMGNMTPLQEYERWVRFYSDLLNSLSEDDVHILHEVDLQTQKQKYANFACQHSILRILDKVFYRWANVGCD